MRPRWVLPCSGPPPSITRIQEQPIEVKPTYGGCVATKPDAFVLLDYCLRSVFFHVSRLPYPDGRNVQLTFGFNESHRVLLCCCIPFCYSFKNLGFRSSINFVIIEYTCQSRYNLKAQDQTPTELVLDTSLLLFISQLSCFLQSTASHVPSNPS